MDIARMATDRPGDSNAGTEAAPLVLVVDDHPTNRQLLAVQLEAMGYRACMASGGREALEVWRRDACALIVTDIWMPEMSGEALARAIRAIEAQQELPRTPIVAWSSSVSEQVEARLREAGVDAMLGRPAGRSELREVLAGWLSPVSRHGGSAQAERADVGAGTASGGPSGEPIDLAACDANCGTADAREGVLTEFQAQTRADVALLDAAAEVGDLGACARMSHRIRGSCLIVAANELAMACEALEAAAGRGDAIAVTKTKQVVDFAWNRLDAFLEGLACRRQEDV